MRAEDVRSVEQLERVVQAGGRVRYLHFWGHHPRPDGTLGPSCLSQWWPAPFEADGEHFATAEHYMMWRKARLFDDEARAGEVLAARTPAEAKVVGRKVVDFDQATWESRCWEIVVAGSVAKFGSAPDLTDYLLCTGRRVLVEASPMDRIWGIGLSARSEFAETPSKWRG